jgi:hypothetical protein
VRKVTHGGENAVFKCFGSNRRWGPVVRASCAAALAVVGACATAPAERTVLLSGGPTVGIRIDEALSSDRWTLAPELNPDVFRVAIENGVAKHVCFVAERDEACFTVAAGESHDFVIMHEGVPHNTRIEGFALAPAAVFDQAYREANRGRVSALVPEAYELVNIAIALTEYAHDDPNLIYTDTPYYQRMMAHFGGHRDHPLVAALNEQLRLSGGARYFTLKMNGYAFVFDGEGRIVASPVYARTGFSHETENPLEPFVGLMQSFADETDFRRFFARESAVYEEQTGYFTEEADVPAMWRWLTARFPDVDAYDTVKIIFSPLVYANQSVTWLESNGFRELQPHLNYPYRSTGAFSDAGDTVWRSNLVFTELNHGFINPTADRFAGAIEEAISQRAYWADDEKAARAYPSDYALFNEYMNWGLFSLYAIDQMDDRDLQTATARLERFMAEGRGFRRFVEFNAMLMGAYRTRRPGETVADLYPDVIAWFREQDAAAGR